MAGNQPKASAMDMMDTNGDKVSMEQLSRLIRELPKDKNMSLTVKLEVRSEEAEAALEDKSKTYQDVLPPMVVDLLKGSGLTEKLLEALKNKDLEQRGSSTNILTARCEGQVTEEQLENIARKFPAASYQSFCTRLGFGTNMANMVLIKHLGNQRPALMDILLAWRNKTGGPRTDLARYLVKADADDLVEILSS